jgi:hypothetical protein
VKLRRDGPAIDAAIRVRNLGAAASSPRTLTIAYDKTPSDTTDDPNPADDVVTVSVPSIPAGTSRELRVLFNLPASMADERVPLYFMLDQSKDDPNHSNDGTWALAERDTLNIRHVANIKR